MSNTSANISIEGVTENGFVLPNGYSWDVKMENGMKEGEVIVRNRMRMVHAILLYHQDKLNGLCLFYNKGKLVEKRTYVNNVAEGWSCELEKGGVEKWYIYRNGKKFSKLVKCEELEEFWTEIAIESGSIISICRYNEDHVKNGKCYLFEDNSIRKIVSYDNGEEKDCIIIFNEEEMTEYDNGGNVIYIGCFENSLKNDYPRHGEGNEMKGDECVYYGNWNRNKKKGYGSSLRNGIVYYEGEWKDNLPNGEGELNDENGDLKYQGMWERGKLKLNENEWFDYATGEIVKGDKPVVKKPEIKKPVVKKPAQLKKVSISRGDELMDLLNDEEKKRSVSELVIEEGCGNELKEDLKISGFDYLKKLVVKKKSLMNLNSLVISDNGELESIRTEDGGDFDKENKTWYAAFEKVKSVVITSILYLMK